MSFAAKITGPTRRVIDTGLGGDWLFDGMARPPAVVWALALLIAALLLVAPVYLALRTLGAGPEAADLIFRVRTLSVVLRTVALMGAVMVGCVVIAAPLAWLTVRAALPFSARPPAKRVREKFQTEKVRRGTILLGCCLAAWAGADQWFLYGLDQTSVSELPKVIPASLHC